MKFLFCSLDSPGFLFPAIAVARDLVGRGHKVAFVTDPSVEDTLRRAGLRRIPCGQDEGPSFKVATWAKPPWVAAQLKHILFALKRFSADVLVGQQLTLAPVIVSRTAGLPLGVIGLAAYLWPVEDGLDQRAQLDREQSRLLWRYQDMLGHYNRGLSLLGLEPVDPPCTQAPFLGDLFLLRSVEKLEGDIGHYPSRIHLVGACPWAPKEEDEELRAWLKRARALGRPVVYAQHGRSFDPEKSWWKDLARALGGRDIAVAASTLRMDFEAGEMPENFFARPHLPQEIVMASAQAVISGANSAVVLGSLRAGLPSLLIPYGGEQPDVALRCRRAGVSINLSLEEVSPRKMRRSLDRLLTQTDYRSRAEAVRSEMRAMENQRAARLLEELARSKKPVTRPGRVRAQAG